MTSPNTVYVALAYGGQAITDPSKLDVEGVRLTTTAIAGIYKITTNDYEWGEIRYTDNNKNNVVYVMPVLPLAGAYWTDEPDTDHIIRDYEEVNGVYDDSFWVMVNTNGMETYTVSAISGPVTLTFDRIDEYNWAFYRVRLKTNEFTEKTQAEFRVDYTFYDDEQQPPQLLSDSFNFSVTLRNAEPVTRHDICRILYAELDLAFDPSMMDPAFTDVNDRTEDYQAIYACANAGIIGAKDESGAFKPYDSVTRAQAARMINLAGITKVSDVQIPADCTYSWAKDYIAYALGTGWMSCDDDGMFRPNEALYMNEITPVDTIEQAASVVEDIAASVDENSSAAEVEAAVEQIKSVDTASLAQAMQEANASANAPDPGQQGCDPAPAEPTIIDQIAQVDAAYASQAGIDVAVDVSDDESIKEISDLVTGDESNSNVTIVGAALNADEGVQEMSLIIDKAEDQRVDESTVYNKTVEFSMELSGAAIDATTGALDVPVLVTIPIPEYYREDRAVITHYQDGAEQGEVVDASFSTDNSGQQFARMVLTHFSDFTIEQEMMGAEASAQGVDILAIFAKADLAGSDLAIYTVYSEDGEMLNSSIASVNDIQDEVQVRCDRDEAFTVKIFRLDENFRPAAEAVEISVTQ
jgi:hypothetical protein